MSDRMYQSPKYIQDRRRLPAPDYLLDWYLKRRREEGDDWQVPVDQRGWRASSLGNCPRAQTLIRRGIEPLRVFDAKTLRAFAWGDFVHDWLRSMYRDCGLAIAEEVPMMNPELGITGHADLVFTVNPLAMSPFGVEDVDERRIALADELGPLFGFHEEIPSDAYGMEIKSVHSNAIKKVFNEGPYPHHRIQVGAYELMAPTSGEVSAKQGYVNLADVERWFITYVGKDSVGLLTFEVEDRWVADARTMLDVLNEHWRRGTLPNCTCQGWQVDFCEFNEGETCCGRNMNGRIAKRLRKVGV